MRRNIALISIFFIFVYTLSAQSETPYIREGDSLGSIPENQVQSLEDEMQAAMQVAKEEAERNKTLFNAKKGKIDSLKKEITDYHTLINGAFDNKERRIVAASYENIIVNCNILVSDFSDKYLEELEDYLSFQKHIYENQIHSPIIDKILRCKELIVSNAGNDFKFIAQNYLRFHKKKNFIPIFNTLAEYYDFHNQLTQISEIQNQFLKVIEEEKQIQNKEYQITTSDYPKDIRKSYFSMKKKKLLSPEFYTVEGGKQVLAMLDNFLILQDKYKTIIEIRKKIDANDQSMLSNSSKIKYVIKAYEIIYVQFSLTPAFSTVEEADSYIAQLNELIRYQDRFLLIKVAPSVKKVNQDLKTAKSVEAINKIIFQ